MARWEISLPGHLCMFSLQDDIEEAYRAYDRPDIHEELHWLDQVERQLQGGDAKASLFLSLFTLCRRLISWRLPATKHAEVASGELLGRLYFHLFHDPTTARVLEWFHRQYEGLDAASKTRYLQSLTANVGFEPQAVDIDALADAFAAAFCAFEERKEAQHSAQQRMAASAAILAQAAGVSDAVGPTYLPQALAIPFRFEQEFLATWYPAAALKAYFSALLENNAQYLASDAMQQFLGTVDGNARMDS
jgi:hypothetical protein